MSEELKPCPFCGAEADPNGRMNILVSCSNMKCEARSACLPLKTWNARAPVESGTVSVERDVEDIVAMVLREFRLTFNEQREPMTIGYAQQCMADSLRKVLALRAPPLSPATPSAELIAAADDLRHEVELLGETSMGAVTPQQYERLFASQAAYDKVRASAAPATPSVTVEEAHQAMLATFRKSSRTHFVRPCDEDIAAVIQLCTERMSLPRAPAKETTSVEGVRDPEEDIGEFKPHVHVHNALDYLEIVVDSGTRVLEQMSDRIGILWSADRSRVLGVQLYGWSTIRALRTTHPRSAVEAEVVERCAQLIDAEKQRWAIAAEKATDSAEVKERNEIRAHLLWNLAKDIRALARAQEGRGT